MIQLRVPINWPTCWWGSDGSAIKMSCPSCGQFALLLTRRLPDGALANLACDGCGLSGLPAVQAAFNAWEVQAERARVADEEAHRLADEERDRNVAVRKQLQTRPVKARAA